MHLSWYPYTLHFTFDAGTSRGILREKKTWIIQVRDHANTACFGLGEAGPLAGLSLDDRPDLEAQLSQLQTILAEEPMPQKPDKVGPWVAQWVPATWPSLRFGLETAILDFLHGGKRILFPSTFTDGKEPININGLIWMGDHATMAQRLEEKLALGFKTIKLKIGAIDFESELALLKTVRERFSSEDITLRVDANGAFSPQDAPEKLKRLSEYELHSIEQPIAANQWDAMATLCRESPIPIALDEELIGLQNREKKVHLLDTLNPPYIILKPTLVGGLHQTAEWIELAEARNIGWWMTSALESNVGLNAIAQFTATYHPTLPQGLGTGQLYHNNLMAPLHQEGGWLYYHQSKHWNLGPIFG